ncbi:hypothetical protein J5N97_008812 [Dioscorea zingiberensis]|uniref:ABC transporter domain-containing protein n=1 Tax=Dioscorea zingiberensis TaxID=325984 RepID=A0A9D5CX09_9LILI|nr:hypothetical protein J5N97_008812 [Dioscorea zingiberensis]
MEKKIVPSDVVWWNGDHPVLASAYSSASQSFRMSTSSPADESVIMVPARGTETPNTRAKMPGIVGCTSPEVRLKIGGASPETAKRVAVRLYEGLKKHGLQGEAERAFRSEEKVMEELKEVERRKEEQLMGMEYLLRDGFVSFLRDFAKITPPIPKQMVKFSGIRYSKKVDTMAHIGYETFGSKLLGWFLGPLRSLFNRNRSNYIQILDGIEGYIMPGSMTLVLGPPGSGKSTLLEILAGRVQGKRDSKLEGYVIYNGRSASEIRRSRLIAYVSSQLNKHIPFLSVRETLEFARECTQGLRPENFTPQMRKFFAHALVEGQDPFLEYVLEILSLKRIEHHLVGDSISDIDFQKLTTAELAMGTYSILLYDQPLSGSDPATTYELVDTIRTISRIQQSSAVMVLNQLSQDVFDLFDRVILLGEGRVLYQGPRQDAIPYFATLGYMKPSHVESGEFLEDIVSGNGMQYLAPGSSSLRLSELAECYHSSNHYKDVLRILSGEDFMRTYWIESEPGIGLSLKTPSKFDCTISPERRREAELVVAKLSTKLGKSGGIESTGRVQVGDVVTGISINDEELQYLVVAARSSQQERASHVYSMLRHARGHIRLQVERYEDEEDEHESQWKQFQGPYVQRWWKSTRTLIHRQFKISRRLHMLIKLRLFQACVLGLFAGSLFYKLGGQHTQQSMNSVRALGFASTMSIMLLNMVQLPLYMLQRPIFYKHKAQRFFRTSSYVVAHSIVNLPQTFIEAFLYTVCVYFLAGLSVSHYGAAFFQYLALLFLVAYLGSSLFFFLSAVSSIPETANALADQLPYCNQSPHLTVGKAYLTFSQVTDISGKTWLPYTILVGWTLFAKLLALLAMKKVEFLETSQSLPQRKEKGAISHYLWDYENNFSSTFVSQEDHVSEKMMYPSKHVISQAVGSSPGIAEDYGGAGKWGEEFQVDMEGEVLGIPVLPLVLTFSDLSFTRSGEGTEQSIHVFESISGYARPSTMLALLGGSKARTTTLLKCLAGRTPLGGVFTGEIQANGSPLSSTFSRVVGYVERLDAHQPYLSVREALQFSAGLRLDCSISSMSRYIHVELVLDQLGLKHYANQLVGSLRDATGKTFEIAKKLTIAVELAANPSVLFLEEPISGLDSAGTSQILRILSVISAFNRIVVATLNHPNTRALSYFHQALILTEGGHQAYFGPVGFNCSELLDYFTSIPMVPQYFQNQNPVSFIMAVLGLGIKTRGSAVTNFAKAYQNSALFEVNIKEISILNNSDEFKRLKIARSKYPASYARQARLVLMRTQRFLWRNVQYTYGRLIGCIMIGLLMGSLYFHIEYTDTYGVSSRSLYICMQCILIGVISANNVIPQIGTDRLVYFRERRAGMYLPIWYPVSWAIGEVPYFILATLALVGLGNAMAGIATQSVMDFIMYWSTLFVFTVCVTYFGMMLTFLAPVPTLAAFATSIVTSMWISTSGSLVLYSDMKFYCKWMFWSSPFQYVINTLTSISFYCDTEECKSVGCKCAKLADGAYVWDRVASLRSLSRERITLDVAVLSGMCLLFATLAFIFFVVLKHNSPLSK